MGGRLRSSQTINWVFSQPRGPSSAVKPAATTIAGITKGMVGHGAQQALAGEGVAGKDESRGHAQQQRQRGRKRPPARW